MNLLAPRAAWALGVAIAACAAPPAAGLADSAADARLQAFASAMLADADVGPLTDDDRARLNAAKLALEDFAPAERGGLVRMLRYVGTLPDGEVPAAELLARSQAALRFPLVFVFVQERRLAPAARLAVLALGERPRDERAYGVWKWWHTFFAPRGDFLALTRDFSEELFHIFESGSQAEREAIADMLGRPGMTAADLPAMRARMQAAK